MDNLTFLREIRAWNTDRETGEEGLTVAGLLMFGKFQSIQDEFPHYALDYQERPEAKMDKRWIDRVWLDGSWSGNLYDFFRIVYPKLTAGLKVPFALKEGLRNEDTPIHEALREALANTLIHADYRQRARVLVVRRPDMFGFQNPGDMRIPIEWALRGDEPDSRNKRLAHLFGFVRIGEKAGTGIPRIMAGWKSQHWRQPSLTEEYEPSSPNSPESSPNFEPSSPNSPENSPNLDDKKARRDVQGRLISTHFSMPFVDDLEHLGADFLQYLEEIAEAPRASGAIDREKMIQTLLQLCAGHYIRLDCLASLVNRKPGTLQGQYLTQLCRDQILRMAFPDKPNDPRQAYTKAGD